MESSICDRAMSFLRRTSATTQLYLANQDLPSKQQNLTQPLCCWVKLSSSGRSAEERHRSIADRRLHMLKKAECMLNSYHDAPKNVTNLSKSMLISYHDAPKNVTNLSKSMLNSFHCAPKNVTNLSKSMLNSYNDAPKNVTNLSKSMLNSFHCAPKNVTKISQKVGWYSSL